MLGVCLAFHSVMALSDQKAIFAVSTFLTQKIGGHLVDRLGESLVLSYVTAREQYSRSTCHAKRGAVVRVDLR